MFRWVVVAVVVVIFSTYMCAFCIITLLWLACFATSWSLVPTKNKNNSKPLLCSYLAVCNACSSAYFLRAVSKGTKNNFSSIESRTSHFESINIENASQIEEYTSHLKEKSNRFTIASEKTFCIIVILIQYSGPIVSIFIRQTEQHQQKKNKRLLGINHTYEYSTEQTSKNRFFPFSH